MRSWRKIKVNEVHVCSYVTSFLFWLGAQESHQSDDRLSSRSDISGSEGGGERRADSEGGGVLEREGRGSHQSAGEEEGETESDLWSRQEESAVEEEAVTGVRLPREPQPQS